MKSWITAALIMGLLVIFWLGRGGDPEARPEARDPSITADPAPPAPQPIGDAFLSQYANPSRSPDEDLRSFGRTLESMLALFKDLDTRHIATNAQLASYLRGENPENLVFVSSGPPVFNAQGQLVDRWNSPLFVHPLGTGLIGIRSAGPDRSLFTDDDFHRLPGGDIQRGSGESRTQD